MGAPSGTPIPAGERHRTLCDVAALVYDYDGASVETVVLRVGSVFQPWEPLDHWRGARVPITLGDGATGFDWGVRSFKGHFLTWDDFFLRCRRSEPDSKDTDNELDRQVQEEPREEQPALGVVATRCWKTPDGHYLLQGAEKSWPISSPSSVRLPHGDIIDHAVPYHVITPAGQLTVTYPTPRVFSLEDTLYIYDLYVVTDGQLRQYMWQQQWGCDEEIKAQGAVLTGLVEQDVSGLPFDPAHLRTR
uniref:Uncharacterized protein n=1 Tax=uncultured Armatimonadetes bacterium TaxID=157466 RepID=A0A6J4KAC1_9BACT|nr:hypothetical protein AVDCRST_MAG63-5026 [uncultured Armatimonadetes bacterium]